MLNRIQRVIDYNKLTSSAFADKIGVPRSTISHILSGRNNPSLDFVMKILASFPQVNTEWLINGIGPMLKVSRSLFPDEDIDGLESMNLDTIQHNYPAEVKSDDVAENNVLEFAAKDDSTVSDSKMVKDSNAEYLNMVRSEDPAEYMVESRTKKAKSTRVIIFYDDGTFSEFSPR